MKSNKISNIEETELIKKRDYIVSKSNALIQKSRYELSVTEQRIIAYICSLIRPRTDLERATKTPFILEYEFNIQDYAKVCGIDYNNGTIHENTKNLLKGLQQKIIWITLQDGTETTINWVNKVWANKRSGKVKVRLDEDMTPFLFDLKEKFTAYGILNILAMKSQYSIRLYELLKSYAYKTSKIFEVDELKYLLMVNEIQSYNRFPDFRRKVLEPAINQINEFTDIKIHMETITKGKKVIKLSFKIENKDITSRISAITKTYSVIDHEQEIF